MQGAIEIPIFDSQEIAQFNPQAGVPGIAYLTNEGAFLLIYYDSDFCQLEWRSDPEWSDLTRLAGRWYEEVIDKNQQIGLRPPRYGYLDVVSPSKTTPHLKARRRVYSLNPDQPKDFLEKAGRFLEVAPADAISLLVSLRFRQYRNKMAETFCLFSDTRAVGEYMETGVTLPYELLPLASVNELLAVTSPVFRQFERGQVDAFMGQVVQQRRLDVSR